MYLLHASQIYSCTVAVVVNSRQTFSLQFEKVDKTPYYTALKKSFYKLVSHMPDVYQEKLRMKFKEIKTEFDDVSEITNML